jgi:DNA helicase-2/ATP-dependent DNA helicase PcrA
LLAAYHASGGEMKAAEAVETFLKVFYDAYIHRSYENPARRLDDIQELVVQIESSASLSQFLSEIALLTNVDHEYDQMLASSAEKVHLSTVHQAKGLEWPVVIVLWVVEGMFPSARSLGETESDAEERRLFYVAVTRAKDELVLGVPEFRRMRDGGFMPCENSRFIEELPPGLLHMYHA